MSDKGMQMHTGHTTAWQALAAADVVQRLAAAAPCSFSAASALRAAASAFSLVSSTSG